LRDVLKNCDAQKNMGHLFVKMKKKASPYKNVLVLWLQVHVILSIV